VLTGYGRGDLAYIGPGQAVQPDYVADDLAEAVRWIIAREKVNGRINDQGRAPQQ
jgi:D-glycero-D-manno-heptose 1,7-bisphosphate phosphatase